MEDDGKRTVQRFWEEVVNGGLFDAMDDVLASDFKLHDVAVRRELDREGVASVLQQVRQEIPDARIVVEEQLAGEGDRVVTRFKLRAPSPDKDETCSAEENLLDFSGVSISTVSNGQIQQMWLLWEERRATEELRPSAKRWKWPPWW